MCGIIGYLGPHEAVPVILEGLRRLEYRGYDSAGLAVLNEGEISVLRAPGKLAALEELAYKNPLHGHAGIGHTRWATHGAPTEVNAHPQMDENKQVAVVHNGIVENFGPLRSFLAAEGVNLISDTDTELIAQLLGRASGDLLQRVEEILPRLEGQFAVVAIHRGEKDVLIAFKNGPPLVIGYGEDEIIVASDVMALAHRTGRILYLKNGEIARIEGSEVRIFSRGEEIHREPETIEWDPGRAEKGGFRHYMLKEIHEQPDAVRNTVLAHLDETRNRVRVEDLGLSPGLLSEIRRVHLVACGTSWHACLVGKFYIEHLCRIPVEVDYASEYRYREPLVGPDVLLIGVTQSGETADTLAAMELAGNQGAYLGTISNVRGSSAWRLASAQILTQAGPEIGVASTKAFTTQLTAFLLLALALQDHLGLADQRSSRILSGLKRLPLALKGILDNGDTPLERAVEIFSQAPDSLFLGRGMLYPIALEGALKLKEISYLHAEGYPAGEMKHGPIALLSEGFPVLALAPDTPGREKVLGNLMEVRARGASVIAVAEKDAVDVLGVTDLILPIPAVDPVLQPILGVVPLQLLAYRVAVELGLDVDQPRNLAKSVTVE